MNTDAIRNFTLWARALLVQETGELLRAVYGLKEDGTFFQAKDMPGLQANVEAKETRRQLERLIADEKDVGVEPRAAVTKLVKEVAFTHLNRFVAIKMLEHPDRHVIRRAAIGGYPEPNGFKMYLPEHEDDYKLHEQGTAPLDELSESPRDRAFRHFLLWQCRELAKEVRVLFDPDNLVSLLFPRPKVLRQIIERLNDKELKDAWERGNEEAIGWVYQHFNEPDLEQFRGQSSKQVPPELVGPRTQNYTPRWVVRFLVQNTLGRLWVSMHADTSLASKMEYLVPLSAEPIPSPLKPIREIRLLDPATGTMHFGLVAFDLLAEMYREEMSRAGQPGWPPSPSVSREDEIPNAILANNLHGIDIDLRAVQLAALALYVRAKQWNKDANIAEVNLACSDVSLFRGQHLEKIADEMALPKSVTRELFRQFSENLEDAAQMGSLVRLEEHFERLNAEELRDAINRYARQHEDEKYFVNESAKGLRLLEMMSRRYDVVFTNPPYLDNRDYNPKLKKFLTDNYKGVCRNLYAAMMQRCGELLAQGGRLGIITGQSFMFISSFERLRKLYEDAGAVECMAHFDYGLFKSRVDTTAFVLRQESFADVRANSVGVYFRLVKESDAEAKRVAFEQSLKRRQRGERDPRVYEYRQGDFAAIPGSPWVYWITPDLRRLFEVLPKLEEIAEPRQGLATADNFRFLKFWWEVGKRQIGFDCRNVEEGAIRPEKWYPYMKGGSFLRWYGNQEYVINYGQNGHELKSWAAPLYGNSGWSRIIKSPDFYFRRGVTYSYLTAGAFSARLSPGGFIFDVAGSSLFPDDVDLVLAVLNSSFAHYSLKLINPTVNFQVGDLSRLPVPKDCSELLRELVARALSFAKAASEEDETTYDFVTPPDWLQGVESVTERHTQSAQTESEIDEEVYRLYEIREGDRKTIESELAAPTKVEENGADESEGVEESVEGPITQKEVAARWIGYAVGVALGRFQPGVAGALGCGSFAADIASQLSKLTDKDGVMVLEEGHPVDLARWVLDILSTIYGDAETERIVRTTTASSEPLRDAVETYLVGEFFRDHVRRYRKRPIYWLIQSPQKNYGIYLFHEKSTPDTLSLLRGNRYLGGRINRLQQDQAEAMLKKDKKKAGFIAELLEELKEFDRRLEAATRVPAKDKNGRSVTVRWEPELDDGVYINAAPLHELLPSWRDVKPQKAWQELATGEYDWSKTSMRYWPPRVLDQCKKNKSFAIAHGLA